MEVHFVHAQASGRLAVVSVLMKAGRKNAAFAAIMQVAAVEGLERTRVHGKDRLECLDVLSSDFNCMRVDVPTISEHGGVVRDPL
jgi:carbonic anhydrase